MKRPRPTGRNGRRAGLCACAVLALSTLPDPMFRPEWLAALLLPGALATPISRLRFTAFERAAAVVALQLGAVVAALHFVGPLHRLAALGATLLPPLAFLALRAEPLDVLRGVFLSFCVLLIGTILGDPTNLQLLGFLAAAAATLQVDVAASAAEDRASSRTARPRWERRAASTGSIVMACLAVCLLTFHALRALPAPSRDDTSPAATPARSPRGSSAGLSSDFNFDNVPGSLISMRGDRLVEVGSIDGRAVPSDLYLRCGHFDIAGLNRWGTRQTNFARLLTDAGGVARVARPLPTVPDRRLRVEMVEPGTGFAYVPPGTFAISNADDLIGDLRAAVFRFAAPPQPGTTYDVAFHTVRGDALDELPDRRLARLTELGRALQPFQHVFQEILDRPRVKREIDPMRVAEAIAAELKGQCSYALREPTGPHRHSILNFLDGNREGFCMHFASVTAICLRLSGIPARIGVGLYGGDPSPEDYGVRIYGSQHAHAWVEIPFADLGWVVFDPTPPAARENLRWIDFDGGAETPADPDEAAASDLVRTERFALRTLSDVWPWLLALAASAVLFGVRWRREDRTARKPAPISHDARSARKLLERILDDLAKDGHARFPGETLERYAARLRDDGFGGARLRDAFRAYQEVRFGGRPFDASRRARLERPPEVG